MDQATSTGKLKVETAITLKVAVHHRERDVMVVKTVASFPTGVVSDLLVVVLVTVETVRDSNGDVPSRVRDKTDARQHTRGVVLVAITLALITHVIMMEKEGMWLAIQVCRKAVSELF